MKLFLMATYPQRSYGVDFFEREKNRFIINRKIKEKELKRMAYPCIADTYIYLKVKET